MHSSRSLTLAVEVFAHVVIAGLEELRQHLQLETVDRFGLEDVHLVQFALQHRDLRFERFYVFLHLFITVVLAALDHFGDIAHDFIFQNFQIVSAEAWIFVSRRKIIKN